MHVKDIIAGIGEFVRYKGELDEDLTEKSDSDVYKYRCIEGGTVVWFQAFDEYTNRIFCMSPELDVRENTFLGVSYHKGGQTELEKVYEQLKPLIQGGK